jgi:hypothetical protein
VTPAELFAALPPEVRSRRELQPLAYLAGDHSARAAYVHNLGRNLALLESARAVLDAASARGLPLLPLKGLVFADALYRDVAARPMADLDMAVRPAQLDAAIRTLMDMGWRRVFPERARYSARHGHDVAFVNEQQHFLELHHHLFHELRIEASVEGLFDRAFTLELLGRARPVPSWDDHLFVVAVHAATHAFGDSALWVLDLALLLPHASPAAAEAEAVRRHAGPAFRSALRTAQRLLPTVPAPPPGLAEHARESLIDLILGRNRVAEVPGRLESLLARAVLTERPSDAVREVLRKLELRAVEWKERRQRSA